MDLSSMQVLFVLVIESTIRRLKLRYKGIV